MGSTMEIMTVDKSQTKTKNRPKLREYLDYGPHGLTILLSPSAGMVRKVIWLGVMIGGLVLCGTHMTTCINRYLRHESQERPSVNKNHKITFPVITLCLNSMHSKMKLAPYEDGIFDKNVTMTDLVGVYYSGGEGLNISESSGLFDHMDDVNMTDFHSTTFQEIYIIDCVFGEKALNCRGGEVDGQYYSLWTPVNTFFGRCLRFSTENLQFLYPGGEVIDKGYKEIQMSIIAGYNDSDWTEGWSAMLDGFSLFINSQMEETLSKPISLIPDPQTLMRISVRQSNRKLLNSPFTRCEDVQTAVLNHYSVYEVQSCRTECLIDFLETECSCRPALFPPLLGFDYGNYADYEMHKIFDSQDVPVCSFKDHVFCAAPKILSFNRSHCPCLPGCMSVHFDIDTISYGLWRDTLMDQNMKLSSFMISVPDGSEIDYAEEPVYDISSLFADVGGAAGLALGMSLATLLGAVEYTVCKLVDICTTVLRAKWLGWKTRMNPDRVIVKETYF